MSRVAIRYAKALFSLAGEQKKLEEIAEDMNTLESLLADSSDFERFMNNPLLSSARQMEVINGIFSDNVDRLTLDFLDLVCRKKRLGQLAEILAAFNNLLLQKRNQVHAEVTSAVAMDDQQLDALRANLEARTEKSVIINTKQDTSLIGGFKVLIDGVIIDNSVQCQLSKLKEKLVS